MTAGAGSAPATPPAALSQVLTPMSAFKIGRFTVMHLPCSDDGNISSPGSASSPPAEASALRVEDKHHIRTASTSTAGSLEQRDPSFGM
eukprot:CAMPEP_0195107696 /NCGR_PEP_ID=MMETSP0448-20130528/82231_1 /TAXON_ID=66468 /ORGANISM="Heterocapsa triquestra, Strain CCMP 448" /LENGTH=88 /DNA_ID=CAMNT_0040144165 /DNA_START=130 /DNA_END=396 /DNA_ORIENTATION=+